jgi:hypothetical protein
MRGGAAVVDRCCDGEEVEEEAERGTTAGPRMDSERLRGAPREEIGDAPPVEVDGEVAAAAGTSAKPPPLLLQLTSLGCGGSPSALATAATGSLEQRILVRNMASV